MFSRPLLVVLCLVLLGSNIATLTWNAASAGISGMLGAIGVNTVYHQMQARQQNQARQLAASQTREAALRQRVQDTGERIQKRTVKSAAASMGSLPAESIPYLGWAVGVGVTGYELMLACDNLRDLQDLYRELEVGDVAPTEAMQVICSPGLNSFSEAWAQVPESLTAEYAEFQAWALGAASRDATLPQLPAE